MNKLSRIPQVTPVPGVRYTAVEGINAEGTQRLVFVDETQLLDAADAIRAAKPKPDYSKA